MRRDGQYSLDDFFAYDKLLDLAGQILDGNTEKEVQIQFGTTFIKYEIIRKLYELCRTRQA